MDDDEGDYYDEEDEISERIAADPDEIQIPNREILPDFEVEESAFGKKIRRRKKKMETRLLKEILMDVKMINKRNY